MLYFNQDKWILKTIENCGPFVDKIYVAWSEKPWSYKVFGDFGQELDKYVPMVTGIGQIYADSDRNWTNIHQ
jgi:hypothetical protein